MNSGSRNIFIDPSYGVFNQNKLFDLSDPVLNRDEQLLPFHRLRESILSRGNTINTADFIAESSQNFGNEACYYSLGILENYESIAREGRAKLKAFVYLEPPVVAPDMYKQLPKLTAAFEEVYLPNTHGDGYSLEGVKQERLRQLHWPLPFPEVLQHHWENETRQRKLVVINGNHKPNSRANEQYSTRIEAMAELSRFGCIDLFGRGWDRWFSRNSLWYPYWRHLKTLKSIYRGPCDSKYKVLSQYDFCLCFENMQMDGYITEKIFDCLYAGTIPIYLGAPNIASVVPPEVFIDARNYDSSRKLWAALEAMPTDAINAYREAGRSFLASANCQVFHTSLNKVFGV